MTPPTASPAVAADDAEPPSLSPSRPLDGDEPPSGVAEQLTYLCEHARQSRAEQIRHGAELRGLRGVVGTLATELQRLGLVTGAAQQHLAAHDAQIASLSIEGARTAARVQVEAVERQKQDSSHDVQLAALQAAAAQPPPGFTASTATKMGAPLAGFGVLEAIGQAMGTSPAAALLAWGQRHPQAGYVAIALWLAGWALSYVRGELSPAQVTALEQRAPFLLRTLNFCHRWAPTMGQAAQGLAPEKAARAAPVIRSIEESRRDS